MDRLNMMDERAAASVIGCSVALLRRSRGITQVCSPEVTHDLTEERGNDAGFSHEPGRLLPVSESWRWRAS
jgi:hypothetical protein